MKSTKILYIVSIIALGLSIFQLFKSNNQKIAYVFVNDVIEGYHAMQDTNDKIRIEESLKNNKLDEFYKDIQTKIDWLKTNHKTIKDSEVLDKQHEIIDLEKVFNTMKKNTFSEIDSIKVNMRTPIFEYVNQYIKDYSQRNGYDYVLGNTGNGNIMYGNNMYDITLEVIDGINVAYNKKKLE